mmetsp:Transcript_263/g.371  ORF Transcript_263/g.371 Transcript_263/m.371 type:complete len:95 (+) Transcript_263:3-287(+)
MVALAWQADTSPGKKGAALMLALMAAVISINICFGISQGSADLVLTQGQLGFYMVAVTASMWARSVWQGLNWEESTAHESQSAVNSLASVVFDD